LRDGWSYNASTTVGYCGAVLIAYNPRIAHKLCGIHVAGRQDKNLGYAEVVTQDMILKTLNTMGPRVIGFPVPQAGMTEADLAKAHVNLDGHYSVVGVMPKGRMIVQPHKSNIKPSLIHDDAFEHLTEPAALTPSDPRLGEKMSPLQKGINKYGEQTKPFAKRDIEAVTTQLKAEFASLKLQGPRRVLTDYEAINGVEGFEFYDRMNMSTSAGYPYVLRKPAGSVGKVWLFSVGKTGNENDYEINDVELKGNYERREWNARLGFRSESVWTDCLKDERRTMEKVRAGKTRVFTIAPVDYTILFRKYFLSFAAFYYQNRLKTHSAVGIDCEGPEWTQLYDKLREVGPEGFAGDYSAFDGKLDPDLIRASCDLINHWYDDGDENALVRQVLMDEMVHTVQIANNLVYVKHRGNPSGNPLTVIINSLVGAYYLRLVWRMSCEQRGRLDLRALKNYDKYVRDSIYGDDNIVAVHPEVHDIFNAQVVHDILGTHHIEYTDADKSSAIVPIRPLDDLTFLKRGFKQHHKRRLIQLAPISTVTIQELTNWIRECDDEREACLENVDTAIRFAYHHGEEYFNDFVVRVNNALVDRGLPARGDCFDDFDGAFISNFL